ncbi:MAG: hypothetical protein F6K18_33865 [Okeania sp. SIO2C2]|uniref:plasmid mobilization protein n=1 Tax=Okeania sp. SIO2C2 TaxID=2607787 RepID=UPI0013BA418A|nr:hypothetical protein [Okeania sp. SIO2C2]NEP91387.1 hypothetical protein [Okeania sp. SIO2C2]
MSKKESSLNSISSRGKKISPSEKRTERIYSQLTKEEMAIFEQMCNEAGVQKGVYIRAAIFNQENSLPKPVPEINRKVWLELARLSANLNQYQRAINSGYFEPVPTELILEIREKVEQLRAELIGG